MLTDERFKQMNTSGHYVISSTPTYIVVELQGRISAKTVIDASKALLTHPGYQSGDCVLWNASNADLSDIEPEVIEDTVLEIDQIYEGLPLGHIAIVSEKLINLGVISFFQEIYNKTDVQVFDSLEAAEDWLGSVIKKGKKQSISTFERYMEPGH